MTAFEHVETLNRSGADIRPQARHPPLICSAKPHSQNVSGQLEEVAYRPLVTVYIQSWSKLVNPIKDDYV